MKFFTTSNKKNIITTLRIVTTEKLELAFLLRLYFMLNFVRSVENPILKIVGNKVKGRISKRVFRESKARQNFQKTNIAYLLIHTRACVYQEVRNVCFSEILACIAFSKHPF